MLRLINLTFWILTFFWGFSQKSSKCTLIFDTKGMTLDRDSAIIRLAKLEESNSKILKQLRPTSSIMQTTIRTDEPFRPWVELWEKGVLIAQSSDFILTHDTITISFQRFPGRTVVKGGENEFYEQNRLLFLALPYTIGSNPDYSGSLFTKYYEVSFPKNPVLRLQYEEYERNVLKQVKLNKGLYFTLYSLYNQRDQFSIKTMEACFNVLKDTLKHTSDGRKLQQYISKAKDVLVGQKLPAITVSDTAGNSVHLNSVFKSSPYTLVDFWASWCVPCRAQLKELKSQYSQLDSTQLQIVTVSIDKNKGDWLKALASDDLKWTGFCDSLGWKGQIVNVLNVLSIPENFIIDREGVIVEKNLRGAQLENFLKEKVK